MTNSEMLISQLQDFTSFLLSLRSIGDQEWYTPIGDGKWSVPDIIAHIMAWDKNFLDIVIPKLQRGEPVILEEDTDVQGFNNKAVEYGKTLNQEQLIGKAVFYRSQIVTQLKKLPEDAFLTFGSSTNSFTLSSFLQNMFISHDTHHKKQIEEYLSRHRRVKN